MENTEVCYVVIDGKEYFFSGKEIFLGIEDKKDGYIEFKNDKKYLNIEKLKREGNYPFIKEIYERCNLCSGSSSSKKEFSKLKEQFDVINHFSDSNYKRGKVSRACDLVIEGIKLSLELYNKVLTKNCYVVIDGKEYFFPEEEIFLDMEDKKDDYIEFKNYKEYLNIEKLKSEGNYPFIRKIYEKCNSCAGMSFMSMERPVAKEFSKLTEQFNVINRLSDSNYKRGNVSRACDLVIEGIKLSLELYNEDNEVLTNELEHENRLR